LAGFEFNEQAIADVANQAVTMRAQQIQSLLDEVQESESGNDVPAVKRALVARWQQEFDRTLTDPHLGTWAEQLAGGARVIVDPGIKSE
jgi:hypothetical protein